MARSDDFEIVPEATPQINNSNDEEEENILADMRSHVKEYEARFNHEGTRSVKEVKYDQDEDLKDKDSAQFVLRYYRWVGFEPPRFHLSDVANDYLLYLSSHFPSPSLQFLFIFLENVCQCQRIPLRH
jgi:hypothetical protein